MRVIDRQGKDFKAYFQKIIAADFGEVYWDIDNFRHEIESRDGGAIGWTQHPDGRTYSFALPDQKIQDKIERHLELANLVMSLNFQLEIDYLFLHDYLYSRIMGVE